MQGRNIATLHNLYIIIVLLSLVCFLRREHLRLTDTDRRHQHRNSPRAFASPRIYIWAYHRIFNYIVHMLTTALANISDNQ